MNIEQKIINNREAFDDVKMPSGSRDRFEARLNAQSSFRTKRNEVKCSREILHQRELGAEKDFSIPLRSSRNDKWLTFASMAAAAAITAMVMVFGINQYEKISANPSQVADNKIVEMRHIYDEKVEEAIINLEDVMENVDDSTRMQINAVIHDLMNMGDVFAEMAPLPEDRQMAIAEQIYDNNLRTLELLTDKLNK